MSKTSSENVTSLTFPAPQEQNSKIESLSQNPLNTEHEPLPQNPVLDAVQVAPSSSQPHKRVMYNVSCFGTLVEQIEEEEEHPSFKCLDTKERADRFQKYETEYKEYLLKKYFSTDIISSSKRVDDATIKASRLACASWYEDPQIVDGDVSLHLIYNEGEDEEEEGEEAVDSPSVEEISADEFISKGGVVLEKKKSS